MRRTEHVAYVGKKKDAFIILGGEKLKKYTCKNQTYTRE
jgi:hypothetical protein